MADDSLRSLERMYGIPETKDKEDFQRRARVLQAMWRETQGHEVGKQHGPENQPTLGSRLVMPWARKELANYLDDEIRAVVREEVLDPKKSKGKLFGGKSVTGDGYARIFNDLLSSQPLCFNLFAHLKRDLALASRVFATLSAGRTGRITRIEFEHSPGRSDPKYTGDRSAFDVYAEFVNDNHKRGFVGIEVKYHENLKGKLSKHHDRYDDIAVGMGCFVPEELPRLRAMPLQQIWRDHLLAGSMLLADDFEDGFSVFLYPRDNQCCADAVTAYRECLGSKRSFEAWTIEDAVAAIRRHTDDPWVDAFHNRYLDFAKLDAALL